jgi:hypothetical protein
VKTVPVFSSILQRRHALPPALWIVALVVAWAALTCTSILLCGQGFIHPESYSFFPHYLSGKPVLELVFDNRVTDWGNYQARELAFVFDWMDAQFIAWCVSHGHPHFFSLTQYVFQFFAGLTLWSICRQHLSLPPSVSFALVLLLWSCPTAQLYTSFYRSAKVGSLLTVLLTIWAWLRARRSGTWRSAALLAAAAALMPMFDKQGLIFLSWLALWLVWQTAVHRSRTEWRLLVAGIAALAFAWAYQHLLGPWLAWKIVGIELNLGYAAISVGQLLHEPAVALSAIAGGVLMAFDSFRIPLGNLPFGLGLLALWWVWRQYGRPVISEGTSRCFPGGPAFLLLSLAVCGLFAVMLILFPQMNSTEHRRFFYPLPVLGIWLPVVAGALAIYLRQRPELGVWVEISVLALVAGNLFGLQEHRFVLRHGKYDPYVRNAARVMSALRPNEAEQTGISRAEAAALLPAAPYFEDSVPPSLREDRIFLVLRSRY